MTPETAPSRRWPFLALAAAVFAIVMTVGPILATRGIDAGGSEETFAGYNVGMMAARSAFGQAAELAAAAPSPAPAPVPAAPAVAPAPPAPVTSEPVLPVTRDDEELSVRLALLDEAPADRATVRWEITVSNDGDEYLWGVYAYLEGIGPVPCEDRQLDAGASTTCPATGPVWIGEHEATAWATAWTIDRMVESFVTAGYVVTP